MIYIFINHPRDLLSTAILGNRLYLIRISHFHVSHMYNYCCLYECKVNQLYLLFNNHRKDLLSTAM